MSDILGALVNLDHPGHYISWGWFQMSDGNCAVVVAMVATFLVALVAPFPGRQKEKRS